MKTVYLVYLILCFAYPSRGLQFEDVVGYKKYIEDEVILLSNEESELIISHGQVIIDKLSIILDTCAITFDETSALVRKMLSDSIGYENNEKHVDEDLEIESLNSELIELEKLVNKIMKEKEENMKVTTPSDLGSDFSTRTMKYFDQTLNALEESCSALPLTVYNYIKHNEDKKSVKDNLFAGLIAWGGNSIKFTKRALEQFLNVCFDEPKCDESLGIFVKLLRKVVKSGQFNVLEHKSGFTHSKDAFKSLIWSSIEYLYSTITDRQQFTSDEDGQEFNTGQTLYENKNDQYIKVLENYPVLSYIIGIILYPATLFQQTETIALDVEMDLSKAHLEVPEHFLSFAMESYIMSKEWDRIDLNSTRFTTLVENLKPFVLRIGGSSANFINYTFNQKENNIDSSKISNLEFHEEKLQDNLNIPKNHPKYRSLKMNQNKGTIRLVRSTEELYSNNFNSKDESYFTKKDFINTTMTVEHWNELVNFIEHLNATLLFDLNQFHRTSKWEWDPTNAVQLFKETLSKHPNANVMWQLGNEPNAYKHHFGFEVTPQDSVSDYKILKEAIKSVFKDEQIKLVGPDVTRPRFVGSYNSWIKKFKKGNGGVIASNIEDHKLDENSMEYLEYFVKNIKDDIDIISWHQYYLNGQTASVEDFIDPFVMDEFIKQIKEVKNLTNHYSPDKQVWLTETSSAYGGGAPDLSNRFVASFLWMSKLGDAAKEGISVVTRQTLLGGHYSLLDSEYYPLPDYWLSLLYKRLVGGKVININIPNAPPTIRIYGHCMNPKDIHYKNGGLVIFGLNSYSNEYNINLPEQLQNLSKFEYILEPLDGNLVSRETVLNGRVLVMPSDEDLPKLNPNENHSTVIHMPKYSLGFWAIPDAAISFC